MRLIDFFDKGVELTPARDFLVDDSGRRSFKDAQTASNFIASGLRRRGMCPEPARPCIARIPQQPSSV